MRSAVGFARGACCVGVLCCVEGRAIGALGDPIESSATVVADIAVGVAHAANPIFGDPHTRARHL